MRIQATSKLSGASHCVVGASHSWSSLPLLSELNRLGSRSVELQTQPSHKLADGLKENAFDISICPSSFLLDNQGFELAMPVGESVRGGRGHCYLAVTEGHPDDVEDLQRRISQFKDAFSAFKHSDVRVWSDSIWRWSSKRTFHGQAPLMKYSQDCSSWSHWARLLYRMLYGGLAYNSNQARQNQIHSYASDSSLFLKKNHHISTLKLELKYGNVGFINRRRYQHVIDLNDVWYSTTSLPFVARVALKSRKLQNSAIPRSAIMMATDLAQAKMRVDPSSYIPDIIPADYVGHSIDLGLIWRRIHYRLGGEEIKSLRLFLHLMRPLIGSVISDESFQTEMMRWQQRETDGLLI